MIVLDSSAAVWALTRDGAHRRLIASDEVHAPHLIDSEVAHALRRLANAGLVSGAQGIAALATLSRMGLTRYPGYLLHPRVWELRDNLSAYDATYVALAESLSAPLVTADARLARAPGIRCAVTVMPG